MWWGLNCSSGSTLKMRMRRWCGGGGCCCCGGGGGDGDYGCGGGGD